MQYFCLLNWDILQVSVSSEEEPLALRMIAWRRILHVKMSVLAQNFSVLMKCFWHIWKNIQLCQFSLC